MSVPSGASNPSTTTPPEIEQTLAMLSGHRSVLGYMVLSRGGTVSIIRHSGVVFEGDQGRKYAGVIERIVDSVQTGLEEISGEQNEGVSLRLVEEREELNSRRPLSAQDEIRFLRIRTKRHELMISPGARPRSLLRRGLADHRPQRSDTYWPSCTTRPPRHGRRLENKIKKRSGNSHGRA